MRTFIGQQKQISATHFDIWLRDMVIYNNMKKLEPPNDSFWGMVAFLSKVWDSFKQGAGVGASIQPGYQIRFIFQRSPQIPCIFVDIVSFVTNITLNRTAHAVGIDPSAAIGLLLPSLHSFVSSSLTAWLHCKIAASNSG